MSSPLVGSPVSTSPPAAGTGESPFDSIRRTDERGEFWSGRDLAPMLGYEADWRNFVAAIYRADQTARNTGHPEKLFVALTEKTGGRPREDFRMSRYAAYLVAMNGDPSKPEVAQAQQYFAVKTREAEVAQPMQLDPAKRADLELILTAANAALISLREAEADRDAARAEVRELEPKSDAWDAFVNAEGDYSVREAAQILSRDGHISIGQRRLFDLLKQLKWIQDARRCYQRHVDLGRVRLKTDTYYDPMTGDPYLRQQVRVTAKGIGDLRQHLAGGDGLMALPAS